MKKSKYKEKDIELTPDKPRPKAAFNWFPGHMLKAMNEIKARIKSVDIVVEIRDARLPLITGNKSMDEALGQKSRLIVFNKANFSDPEAIKAWEKYFERKNIASLFINCFEKGTTKLVIDTAKDVVRKKHFESNPEGEYSKRKLRMMILGLPNTGKSTIINQLAGRNAARTADKPGHTRAQQWIALNEEVELLDTPGILPPVVEKDEHAIWLSLIHAIPDTIVGEEDPAIYLINMFKKMNSEEFRTRYKLESLDLELVELLDQIAINRGFLKQKGMPDYDRIYKAVLHDFRQGELGRVCFEKVPVL